MNRAFLIVVAVVGVLVSAGTVSAQQVRVVKKPVDFQVGPDDMIVYDVWNVSAALRDDAQPTMDWGTYPTQAAAVAAAQRGLAKNHAVSSPSDWTYAKYCVVEGMPSRRHKQVPTTPDSKKAQNDAASKVAKNNRAERTGPDGSKPKGWIGTGVLADTEKTLNNILKGDVKAKNNDLERVFDRVKEFREYATRNVEKVSADDFKKINDLIKEYNSKAKEYSSQQPGGAYFAALPRLTPINADDLRRQTEKWKKATQSQEALDKEKEALDKDRARLEKERQQLMEKGQALEQEVASVGDVSGLVGSRWEIPSDGNIFGLRIVEFTSKDKLTGSYNVEASRRELKWRSVSPGKIEVEGGRTATINGDQMQWGNIRLNRTKAGTPDPQAQAKLNAVREKQRDRQSQVDQYKSDFAKYNQRLAAYEAQHDQHRTHVSALHPDAYREVIRPGEP
jgi:hypothetical protein